MKILVAIKRVVDPGVRVRPLADGSGMDITNAKMSINPFCEIALEEAIRLKEQGLATEIVVVCVGSHAVQEQLRSALALGADRAIHISTDAPLEPLAIAKILHTLVQQEQPQIVLLGKQSIDGDHNQTGQMLAALCGYPQGTFASRIEFKGDEIRVTRELDGGLQTLALKLPAVITTDLRLNQPRYPTMPNIMRARQKPLVVTELADLGLNLQPRLQILSVDAPKVRQQGIKVSSVAELVDKLRQEAKVL
ncbi:MAG: electron transfer flavoprotein subunit beta/FixA family protein [Cellvibrio sp.]|uniref:electron transfer flavoprotein subunit beta/FixA family protein n=1 Tax=Cellvibrio sp. TaxID=1965322 RepID=UPI00271B7E3E|nr:electron transfer flavoprotein subunit beta/FixA family protein [Cellvibrio sp.]